MELTELRPLRGKIIAQRLGDPEKVGSLYIPDTVKERPQKGIVVAVGEGVENVEPGDAIIWQPWVEKLFRLEPYGEQYAIVDAKVVEGVLVVRTDA